MEGGNSRVSAPAIGLDEGVGGLGRVEEGVGLDELFVSPRGQAESPNGTPHAACNTRCAGESGTHKGELQDRGCRHEIPRRPATATSKIPQDTAAAEAGDRQASTASQFARQRTTPDERAHITPLKHSARARTAASRHAPLVRAMPPRACIFRGIVPTTIVEITIFWSISGNVFFCFSLVTFVTSFVSGEARIDR